MTILLDTSVIIDALRFQRGRREFLKQRNDADDKLTCSVMTVAEIYAGMMPSEARRLRNSFRVWNVSRSLRKLLARRAA